MSLPLTRRFARAAATTAVGAAALTGIAGTAHATVLPESGGSSVLGAVDENTLDHTVQQSPVTGTLQDVTGAAAGAAGTGIGDLMTGVPRG